MVITALSAQHVVSPGGEEVYRGEDSVPGEALSREGDEASLLPRGLADKQREPDTP